ncbi:TIGR03560 family F420-dependent LLM class oxidoreductase [Actinoplanes sp. Pm04-4]|uniref:TIGR03560 family F420-dependent LLM class oxidoreductase n=1 Tax=Paractinoplanes pyxinae TaxID=2997416 RepID=A0ABT4BFU2_9ACTN|nr:TIGR03560 family F420-dependent LLM class oxidoreductase [Actinoplanes pyxinae]MCY1145415.1 TIGR03560 family F420-dependent LLM class oxidoreductase [Actinoplanes pyxinae]
MDVSVSLTSYPADGSAAAVTDLGQAADELGLHTVWVTDHLIQADPAAAVTDPMLEAYAVLAFLAATTRRVRLGAMVSPVSFRPPALLIKSVTTLDVLSAGRAWLGVGAGYQQDEARAMGVPLPAPRERFEHLDDTVRLAAQMWRGDTAPFHGFHARLERPLSSPQPVTRPHPPILIGGTGERRTLRLVAEHADACNLFDIPDGGATIRHKLAVLREHCAAVGRDDAGIIKTVSTAIGNGEPAEQFAGRCAELKSYGLDHVVVIARGRPLTVGDLERVAAARTV